MTQIIDLGKLRFSFAGDFSISTTYELNDIVKYGGNVYVFTYAVRSSGQLPTNTTYWALMVEGIKFKGVFSSATAYKVGDGVAHGGKVYIAVADTSGNVPPNTTYWSQFADGIQYEGVFSGSASYQKNDIVSYGSSGYIALQDTSANLPTNATFWAKLIEGVSASGAWNSATAYVPNDLVAYGANQYKSIANNTNQLPINSTGTLNANWILMTEGVRSKGVWATSTEYYINDVVSYGGNSYICTARNASTTFATDLTANKWIKFNGGVRWRGPWQTGGAYLVDDIVRDATGSAYISILDHTAGGSFSADLASKWALFALGGGDVLPVIQNTDTGQSLTVTANGSALDWIGATQSANVFYVAPHGTNTTASGKNLATPFASIKYACSQAPAGSTIFVKTGTYSELLPITVPANVAIVGDNQRTTIVEPVSGLSEDGVNPNSQTSMWLLSNGSILNKMTFKGMTGWVPGATPENVTTSAIKGVFVRFNPASPITTKSPYVLECAAIGSGGIGAFIDGSTHASGAKTMIFHGYTVISDNGIGYWVKDGGKAEIVSCFTYYCYFGYTASGGGFIRALNGNNSYGTWGATARGFDASESAVTGAILGQQLAFTYGAGTFLVGETVTSNSGATGVITNVQYSANKLYIRSVTGTFAAGNTLTTTSGGTGAVNSGALTNQSGFVLVLNNLTALPKPGSSISLAGDAYSYVVQTSTGTYTNSASEIVIVLAQEKPSGSASGTVATIRYIYSQIRLTGHDFLSIGTGGTSTTNYPNVPTQTAAPGNETDEAFPGRVYYVSTDQDGNFRVGEYFRIDQATGKATLNASAFDLSGLSSLKLGSIGAQLGETINEFSSDATMGGVSNFALPTEYAVKTYVDTKDALNVLKAGSTMTGALILSGAPATDLQAATKLYADTAAAAKQATLVSGTNIKTINSTSILGSGDIVISGGGGITPVASGTIYFTDYFSDISWPNTNTQSYGWLVQRIEGVTSGVAQFGLVQGGYRANALGGCSGTVLPFQVNANNTVSNGTGVRMWTNGSSPNDFSTCYLVTDNHSGAFYYAGNIPWPSASHVSGWGSGLVNANNTAGSFTNTSSNNSNGCHTGNGQSVALRDSDGYGWRGSHGGYANVDGQTRIHQIDYSNPNSISLSQQNPSANTSTTANMTGVWQDNSTYSNTAISGVVHWRDGSSYIVARVFASNSNTYTDYNSSQDWDSVYGSSFFYGFALSTGAVLVYHGAQTWLYTAHNSRTNVGGSHPFNDPSWRNSTFITDGTDSWLALSTASGIAPSMQKWTINPSTRVWTKNWESSPITFSGQSYMKLNKLPNNRILFTIKPNSYMDWYIFNRSSFPV